MVQMVECPIFKTQYHTHKKPKKPGNKEIPSHRLPEKVLPSGLNVFVIFTFSFIPGSNLTDCFLLQDESPSPLNSPGSPPHSCCLSER
jgi:hypothetical protein